MRVCGYCSCLCLFLKRGHHIRHVRPKMRWDEQQELSSLSVQFAHGRAPQGASNQEGYIYLELNSPAIALCVGYLKQSRYQSLLCWPLQQPRTRGRFPSRRAHSNSNQGIPPSFSETPTKSLYVTMRRLVWRRSRAYTSHTKYAPCSSLEDSSSK